MFCCGKKKEKSKVKDQEKEKEDINLQKIVPNQEKKPLEREEEIQEKLQEEISVKQKENIQENKEDVLEILNILRIIDQDDLYSKLEPLKQSCLKKEEGKINFLVSAISTVLQDPYKESPQTQLNAVQLLLETFKNDNEKMQTLVAKDILPKYQKITTYFIKQVEEIREDKSFDIQKNNYFVNKDIKNTEKEEEEDIRQILEPFIMIILECIVVWGLWFPKSKYEKVFLKLAEQDLEIPHQFKHFPDEDGKKLSEKSQAYNKLNQKKKGKNNQFGDFFKQKNLEFSGLMLGLDDSGKTTILYQLKLKKFVTAKPTKGFNSEIVVHKNVDFTIFDLGGEKNNRKLWKQYYSNIDALIFVIDYSNDKTIEPSKKEFLKLLKEEKLKDCPILIFANKIDIQPAEQKEAEEKLGFNNIKDRIINIKPCSGKTGDGLKEGLDWVVKKLKR